MKKKIKSLEKKIYKGEISTKDAYIKICGHLGYIQIANIKNLSEKLFFTNMEEYK